MTMETNDPRQCMQCQYEGTTECDCEAPQVTFLEISRFQEFCMLGTALVLTILYYTILGVPLAIGWLIGKVSDRAT